MERPIPIRGREARPSRPRALGPCAALAAAAAVAVVAPASGSALEPRYDHRDQQGPTFEALYLKDVIWRSSSESTSSGRAALRLSWGFDPTGDGNELLFGASWSAPNGSDGEEERILLTVDARYRACVGIDQFKTLLEVGLWGSALDSLSVGPVLGLGFIYDFSRNVGLFAAGSLAASIGEVRVVTFGGGLGIQLRYE